MTCPGCGVKDKDAFMKTGFDWGYRCLDCGCKFRPNEAPMTDAAPRERELPYINWPNGQGTW